ncbi:MAG: pdaC 2 [Gammaproteobacteria bacterium]|nr:pdaC 2 [Gammaproteobacteria bacterium]
MLLSLTMFLFANVTLAGPASSIAASSAENDAVIIDSHLKVISRTQNEENHLLNYTLNSTYPQIIGTPLPIAAQNFNKKINNMVKAEIEQFKNNVKQDFPHIQTLPQDVRKNTLQIDYDVDVIHPEHLSLVSVRLNIEGMQAGRAHPFHLYRVLNFDLTHNKELVLNDLFKPKTNYLHALSNYSNKKLNSSLKDKWMIAKGTKANQANYKNWNIQADSILITFDEYQVAPYSNGPQEVEIPFGELKNIFSPQALIISRAKDASSTLG